ncbi:MAG: cysteine desulfurase [Planctomycetes bacterium]|nr:cysteine desulfurase [Planctomycetota bacterium]MCB9912407.1 cysteine desulfurase [Planctomycetota bacterium]
MVVPLGSIGPLYLDYNATSPLAPGVLEAMLPFLREEYHNPSSASEAARPIRQAVEVARRGVAELVGARQPNQIVFTSGGTESIHAAFHMALATGNERRKIVLSSVEHSASKGAAQTWQERGYEVLALPVDSQGLPHLDLLEETLAASPVALVSWILANNETGVVLPDPQDFAERVHRHGARLHVDAVQAPGKLPLHAQDWQVDWLSVSGHKFGAPKGVGALYERVPSPSSPWLQGGGQESGRRGGTENVASVVGLGAAALRAHLQANDPTFLSQWEALRDRLEQTVLEAIPGAGIHGQAAQRVPNTTFLSIPGQPAELLLPLLEGEGLLCSAGSACDANHWAPSPVLLALGVPPEVAAGSLRLSLGPQTNQVEIDRAAEILIRVFRWLAQGA